METVRINRTSIGVLLIDAQPAFIESAFVDQAERKESLLVRLEHLLMLADWMDLPMVATFETPVGLNGELPERLERLFPAGGSRFVKNHFDCTSEPTIVKRLEELSVGRLAVAGAETDVCVLQTTLGLLEMGYEVHLLEDCLFSSESQPGPALRRMYQAGAIPATLKSMAYELVKCVDELPWYPDGWAMKDHTGAKPFPATFIRPEEWPEWEPRL